MPVERGRQRLAEIIGAAEKPRSVKNTVAATASTPPPVAWHRRPWVVSLATAAAVLAIVVVYGQSQWPSQSRPAPPASGWGWSRSGALPQDLPRAAYLDHLASTAADWFRKRPDAPIALARRIAEFRQGCSVLILSEHRPLSPEDRTWLVAKCRAWAARLDAHLAAVEAGEAPEKVRAAADETVNRLITALRDRAGGHT